MTQNYKYQFTICFVLTILLIIRGLVLVSIIEQLSLWEVSMLKTLVNTSVMRSVLAKKLYRFIQVYKNSNYKTSFEEFQILFLDTQLGINQKQLTI